MSDEHTAAGRERTEAQLTEPQPAQPSQRESLLVPVLIVVGLLVLIGVVLWTFSRVLLDVEPHTATATALLMAVAIVAILSFAASRKRVTNGSLLMTVVGVAGAGMLLSGIALTIGTGEGETGPTEGTTIALAAPEGAAVAGFDQKQLSAPADTAFTIAFNNQDPGVQHNVVIASDDPQKTPDAETFFTGEVVTGPMQVDYPVEPLAEGEYFFYCEIHPTTMFGTLTVAPGATPGGNTQGQVIAAQNIAFDTDTLTFPADTPSQLTFQNNDAGTPHNVAIYTDESLSKALFTGEVITGPASTVYDIPALPEGSYYFHCDVHPNMHGTVEVGKAGGGGGGQGGGGEPPPTSGAPPPSSGPPSTGSASVTAQGLAFTPTEISLPASQASTITFDNQDSGVQHNIDIFSDSGFTTSVWKGDVVTGVASVDYDVPALDPATYYFRCDIHPTMTGTVTVG